jgi:fimbrial chaperone protein
MLATLRYWLRAAAAVAVLMIFSAAARAGASLLIWPLDPTIEAGRKAGVLWLENAGNSAVTLQIRVFAWDQQNHEDAFVDQNVIVATPPFATIEPGKKQLVRLTLTAPVAAGEERAFRILIDEIPLAQPAESSGLRFQMRYSLPLFAYGQGLWRKEEGRQSGAMRAEPALSWTLVEEGGTKYVQVRNSGRGHARLSQVRFVGGIRDATSAGNGDIDVATGLLGYVLPGRTMRWPVPAGELAGRQLQAQLEANARPVVLPGD